MNHTIEDSKKIVFLSWEKDHGKELEVENYGEKDNQFLESESMQIKVDDAKLMEDGTLVTENGKIANFADYKEMKEINEKKITKFAIEKRKESNNQARA